MLSGCKNGTDLLDHHAKYGGDRASRAGSRRKVTKFVITETLWCSVIFKTIMVSLHRGRFVVVHLYSTFSVDPRIFPYWQICTKKPCFRILGAVSPYFFWSHNGEIWHEGADLGLPPQAKFCRNGLREYTPFEQIYTPKIPILAIWGLKTRIFKPQRCNLARGCGPRTPSPKPNFVKVA